MKSLVIVQKISKVLKILATIGMVCCFVGVGCCLVGGSVVLAMDRGVNIPAIFGTFVESDSLDGLLLAVKLFANMVICLGGALVCTAGVKYLKHELADGTPFTHRGARELMLLGIKTIAYPVGAVILASIIVTYWNLDDTFTNTVEAGLGIALILLSFVFRYGAELEEKARAAGNIQE